MARADGRTPDELRNISLEPNSNPYAEGSCLIRMGGTLVSCTASVEEGAPPWRRGSGLGWVTAEYSMLPRATTERTRRERRGAGGRTQEIQRLIGRSLRACLKSFEFGEYTIIVDCDVLQADGGTRTASITGGAVALHQACAWLAKQTEQESAFEKFVCAISAGVVGGELMLDLAYSEDSRADVDANIVAVEPDEFVEVQATGEQGTLSRKQFDGILDLATAGTSLLFKAQKGALGL